MDIRTYFLTQATTALGAQDLDTARTAIGALLGMLAVHSPNEMGRISRSISEMPKASESQLRLILQAAVFALNKK